MSRLIAALCLSTSLIAVGIAGFALIQASSRATNSPPAEGQDARDMRLLLASLDQKVTELERRYGTIERKADGVHASTRSSQLLAPAQEAGIAEQVQALSLRLATLEDEKTIAQLAQSGEAQLAENELRTALGKVGDPSVSPDSRLEALKSIRRLAKTKGSVAKGVFGEIGFEERDIVMPMLELARDTTLAPEFRAEVVDNLAGSKVEELRRPLLDLLAFDKIPDVRGGAAQALMWHLDDGTVREAIRGASRADPDETVRKRAESYLPKVEHFDRMAAEAAGTAPAGQGK